MDNFLTCEDCGTTLPGHALQGLCPKCLAGMALSLSPDGAANEPLTEQPGDCIGRFKLLQKIGEGGCGTVYLAGQEEPVRRQVALKVIKLGMDTRQVIARFEAERQTLALMDHPNIAKVFDAGETESGRPYFVMERVRGTHLTRYCDENNLSTRERLELFIQVCQAIQHAHQKGIIHRDIKPSNILVTVQDGVAAPKIIDFGIAKATQQRLSDQNLTEFHQFLGTPAYMSPEQAASNGMDLDTRSDIYALGVLLYELLTGTTPFDGEKLRRAGFEEMCRTIRELEPPKPSARLAQEIAEGKSTQSTDSMPRDGVGERGSEEVGTAEPHSPASPLPHSRQPSRQPHARHRLVALVRGDLDWIVMKALEKDRARRYESAAALAADVQCHLLHEPVIACPPTTLYQVRKFARRHRTALSAAGAVTIALIAGVIASTWQAVRATRSERAQRWLRTRSEQAAAAEARARQTSDRVAGFLASIFQLAGPSVLTNRDTVLMRELLDRSAKRLGRELRNDPEVEARVRRELGLAYVRLNARSDAETMFREALRLYRLAPSDNELGVALTLGDLAETLQNRGALAEAEAAFREALPMQKKLLGTEHLQVAICVANLGVLLDARGDSAGAEAATREALAMRRKLVGEVHSDVEHSLWNLAVSVGKRGAVDEAENYSRQALAISRQLHTNDHPDLASSLFTLGTLRMRRGDTNEAETLLTDALAMRKRLINGPHPDIVASLLGLAALRQTQDLPGAQALRHEALAMQRRLYRAPHPRLAQSLRDLAALLLKRDDPAGAEPLFLEALAMDRKLWTNNPARCETSLLGLSDALVRQEKYAEAEKLLRAGVDDLKTGGGTTPSPRPTYQRLVRLYEAWESAAPNTGKSAEATRWRQTIADFDKAANADKR